MEFKTLIEKMKRDGSLQTIGRNLLAQFGPQDDPFLGATLLPERIVRKNEYRDTDIRFRTVIANSGTRYSPAQLKDTGEIIGSMLIELGDSDVALQLKGDDYDALLDYLMENNAAAAQAVILDFIEGQLNGAGVIYNEKQRFDAIIEGKAIRQGDNGYREDILYPNPAGHRVPLVDAMSNPSVDPWLSLTYAKQKLASKGIRLRRIITSDKNIGILSQNPNIAKRTGRIIVVGGTAAETLTGTVTRTDLDAAARADGLPAFETYDKHYFDQSGFRRFMREDAMIFVGTTGQDERVRYNVSDPAAVRLVPNTIGYVGVGRAAGQTEPGRVIEVEQIANKKPPRVEGEMWQTSLTVINQPEAFVVLTGVR